MVVGKVNAALQSHFEKTGATMAKEWKADRAGDKRCKLFYQHINKF